LKISNRKEFLASAISMDLQTFVLTAKPEGVEKNVKVGFTGEEANPLDHRAGDEVQTAWFSDNLAASHGAWGDKVAKQSFAGK
jgi:hypothetical protein